jgi:hypothetical protein
MRFPLRIHDILKMIGVHLKVIYWELIKILIMLSMGKVLRRVE